MRIRAIHVRRFRSVEAASLKECGGLNVLIGKNNAGKSNILSAIDLALGHLRNERVAGPWGTSRRPADEFSERRTAQRVQIGIEFSLSKDLNNSLREEIRKEAPQLERLIAEIGTHDTVSFIVAGALDNNTPFLFLEAVSAGAILATEPELGLNGITLLQVPVAAAHELFRFERDVTELRKDLAALEQIMSDPTQLEPILATKDTDRIRIMLSRNLEEPRPVLFTKLMAIFRATGNFPEVQRGLAQLLADTGDEVRTIEGRETSNPISAFAGEVRTPPKYVFWLMEQYGSMAMLHFRENKQPIGPDEAAALLKLKVRRGGEERLQLVRQTVRSLLGVTVDAFEPEEGPSDRRYYPRATRRIAEMDINNFVVEANGAGIREALRIILDVELKGPALVLIEEPEIHLHPGLEHSLYEYLKDKSRSVQTFVTTHSTNFVDTASLQNVYMISRGADKKTGCETLFVDDAASRIPSELGLRLSTVFMYDRLLFVEGRSDEEVLRELARQLNLDLTRANVGFVQMGGIRNFAHFAAEATLDILSRRRVRMWFLADRDERDDAEVTAMVTKLGARAKMHVLARREIDNYLIVARAVAALVSEKLCTTPAPAPKEVQDAIVQEADALKEEVVRLRVEKRMLAPIYLQARAQTGTAEERIRVAIELLNNRTEQLASERAKVCEQVETEWPSRSAEILPGAKLLERVMARYGLKYSKASDGPRLARMLVPNEIDSDLACFLRDVAAQEG